jgi:hypothetical protein
VYGLQQTSRLEVNVIGPVSNRTANLRRMHATRPATGHPAAHIPVQIRMRCRARQIS